MLLKYLQVSKVKLGVRQVIYVYNINSVSSFLYVCTNFCCCFSKFFSVEFVMYVDCNFTCTSTQCAVVEVGLSFNQIALKIL